MPEPQVYAPNYNLNRLTRNSQDFVFSFMGTNESTKNAFSMALAIAILGTLTPPLATTLTPEEAVGFRIKVTDRLNQFNNVLRIHVDKVLDYATKFMSWKQRQMDSTDWVNFITDEKYALEDFFGLTKVFTIDDLLVIKAEARMIGTYAYKLKDLLGQLGYKPNVD